MATDNAYCSCCHTVPIASTSKACLPMVTDTYKSDDSSDENSNSKITEPTGDNEECYMCNGYYVPCFGNPVCAICHAFLFPDHAVNGEPTQARTETSDDGDSGNDEPEEVLIIERGFERLEIIIEQGPPDLSDLPELPNYPPDSLRARLYNLSIYPNNKVKSKQVHSSVHIEVLPPEVLLVVFSYLDDLSLWNVGNVCRRWNTLIKYKVPGKKWEELTLRMFPLFKTVLKVNDWFQVYSNLMSNCSCFACLKQMTDRKQATVEEGSWRRNRLRSELKILRSDPPDGIQAMPLDPPTCCHWQATILGPTGSPYEGGIFYLYLQVPFSYPMCPPVVRFLTKIFHPNVSRHGDVGIDSIHYNWSLALTLSKVLISVQSLLTDPYCEVCMEPEIGKLYVNDQPKFDMIAQQWTWRYAMTDFMPNR